MAADRKNSDAPQHETYPGPGPGRVEHGRSEHGRSEHGRSEHGTSGVHPVEQMVEAAIERIGREYEATRDSTPAGAVVPRQVHALARPEDVRHLPRLRWRGHEVSEEFRRYAERVARGEELPPFEGRILAEPSPDFPWEPGARRRAPRRSLWQPIALWGSAAVVGSLLAWTISVRIAPQPRASFPAPPNEPALAVLPNRAEPTPPPASAAPPIVPAPAASAVETAPPEEEKQEVASASSALESAVPPSAAPPPPPPARAPAPPPEPTRSTPARASAPSSPPSAASSPPTPPATERVTPVSAETSSAAAATAVDISTPGALRDALGALLAARSGGPEKPAAKAPVAEAPAPAARSPEVDPSPAAATKEPDGAPSGKGSLLVEKPSF